MAYAVNDAARDFPDTLRTWRRARHMSQLELSLASGVSARHLSFLETGRAQPSREMVLHLADALSLPRAARNALLGSAGFAALYPATPLEAETLAPLRAALEEMMSRHEPYPALLCDRYLNVLDANAPARAMLAALNGPATETNLVRLLTDGDVAHTMILNLGEMLAEFAARLRLEAFEIGQDSKLAALQRALEAAMLRHPPPATMAPRRALVPVIMAAFGMELRFLSAIAHFGTSDDITVQDLRLELLFPADDATRAALAEAKF